MERFTEIHFRNYKAFRNFKVYLKEFNVLVGPNNAGKSTILGALRLLSEGLRRARSRKSDFVQGGINGLRRGYPVSLKDNPISTENVFYNYDDSEPASVSFKLSNKNELILYFPEKGMCYLLTDSKKKSIISPTDFKKEFPVSVGIIPVLGPVEHNEELYQQEAARLALLSNRASRNFRNIWYHYPEGFNEFREAIRTTWPGMDVKEPELDRSGIGNPILNMFCPEERIDREIYWSGFGFQVWCQMLTHIIKAKNDSILIIDEPDIYLHADVQRRLVGLLKKLGPDIVIATHSTEIISEVDSEMLLFVNKNLSYARRINSSSEILEVFNLLGSTLNPVLTELTKTHRAVFVEGKDFKIISEFARKLGNENVANRCEFALLDVQGFNPQKVKDLSEGIERAMGCALVKGVILDRDYRSDKEVNIIKESLQSKCLFFTIHEVKEIENYLLYPQAILRAINKRITQKERRGNSIRAFNEKIEDVLNGIADGMKNGIVAQYIAKRRLFEKKENHGIDDSSIIVNVLNEVNINWASLSGKMKMVPGKEFLAALNSQLQKGW